MPEAVSRLWDCVKRALAANDHPAPRRIDRWAAAAGCELAASTVEGWFKTWSVVPTWEKFQSLIKALAAEHDEDWRSLHQAALTADRERKRDERRRKELGPADASVSAEPIAGDGQPDSQRSIHDDPAAAVRVNQAAVARANQQPDGSSPAPATAVPAAVSAGNVYDGLRGHPHPTLIGATPESGSVPRQLPVNVAHFTGRVAELAKLDALITRDKVAFPAATVISVIAGTAGVGKTALVVHWAHGVRDYFPDGQLFVNLRGYDAGPPMTTEQALAEFLRALNVPVERIPAGLGERAMLYRSLLDGRRVLIVLDNANSAEQVRPLLPGSPACRVVITSRSRLSSLIARDGASRATLDLLPPTEAIALLRAIIGTDRVAAEPEATDELANQCAYLPLALRIAAERAVTHPHATLADLTAELAVEHDRLDLLATVDEEDESTAVHAVFSWSYHALPRDVARAFRLLGLHAGPDISTPAAAALLSTTTPQARRLLETLASTHLIEESERNRYRFHDLLRVYSAGCAKAEETDQDRDAAVHRVLNWYLHTGDAADRVLNPRRRIPLDDPEEAYSPLEFATYGQALDWCETERVNLVAAIHQAAEIGEQLIACKLPLALWGFFNLRKHWADLIATHRISLAAAQHLHYRRGEAWAWAGLGMACLDLQQHEEALIHFKHVLPICREIGESWGEAIALLGLGRARFLLGEYQEALDYSQQGLRICDEINDPWSQSLALLTIGITYRKLQRFQDALNCFQRILSVAGPVRDKSGEAMALHNLGDTYRDLQRFEEALEFYQRACTTYCKIGDRWGEAKASRNIGDSLLKLSQAEAAVEYWQRALTLFTDLGDPVAAKKIHLRIEGSITTAPPGSTGYQFRPLTN